MICSVPECGRKFLAKGYCSRHYTQWRKYGIHPKHLRWATQAENNKDKILHGTTHAGERNPQARLTWADVRVIRERADSGETHGKIALDYGVNRSNVSQIARGVTWRLR